MTARRRPCRLPSGSAKALLSRALTLVAISVGGLAGWAQTTPEEAWRTLELVVGASQQVQDGAVLFDHHCSACHGDTGRGFAEAKTSFPENHQRCTSCHKPNNPSVMPQMAMTARNVFDIGLAPAVTGPESRLARFGNAAALYGYVRATMPRPWPGALEEETYLAIVAFLMAANGAQVPAAVTVPDLAQVRFP